MRDAAFKPCGSVMEMDGETERTRPYQTPAA